MFAPGTLESFGLYLVRTSALVLAAPLLGSGLGFVGQKIGLIGALALVLYAATGAPLPGSVGTIEFGVLALREVLIGFALAFVLQMVLLGVRVGGELIGQEMGFNMAGQVDPETGINTPLVTQLYEGLFLLGLFAVDGHHLLLRALSDSFAQAPVGVLASVAGTAAIAKTLIAEMFAAGIVFALPVLVLMSVVSILIALLSRAVPQLNVMDLGFTLRILLGLTAMYIFAPLAAPAMEGLVETLSEGLKGVVHAVHG